MNVVANTERLTLSRFSESDIDGFFELNNDSVVLQYTGDQPFANKASVADFIENYSHYNDFGYGRWSVYLTDANRYIGFCGLRYNSQNQEVDIGFRLLRRYWGQGLATEAAKASINIGINQYKLNSIIGRAMKANSASHAVLTKLDFRFEKEFVENSINWNQYRFVGRQE